MINIEDFNSNLLKIDRKIVQKYCWLQHWIHRNYKNWWLWKYLQCKPLIINEVHGYIEEESWNAELWDGIKYEIEAINGGKPGEYGKDFMKIKLDSGGSLPLNKTLKLHSMTIIVRSVFEEDGKFYPQVFLEECLYKLQNWCFRRNWYW